MSWLVGKQGSRYYVLDSATEKRVWRDQNGNPLTNAKQAMKLAQRLRDEAEARNNPQRTPDPWLATFRENLAAAKQARTSAEIDRAVDRLMEEFVGD